MGAGVCTLHYLLCIGSFVLCERQRTGDGFRQPCIRQIDVYLSFLESDLSVAKFA